MKDLEKNLKDLEKNSVVFLEGICKTFGGIYALDHVDFDLSHEVHSIVGHNGAGKSTLVKILMGGLQPDEGKIFVNGKKVLFNSPGDALHSGVVMVWQELSNFPNMSITENMMARRYIKKGPMIDWKANHAQAREYLMRLNLDIDPRTLMKNLPLSLQQLVEVSKALSYDPAVVILDEPTSALSFTEQDVLYEKIRMIKQHGVAVVYISHKLEEVMSLSDRVTVLRDGVKVFTRQMSELNKADLVQAITGAGEKQNGNGKRHEGSEPRKQIDFKNAPSVIKVDRLNKEKRLHDVSFELKKGEILGITGVSGSGIDEIGKILYGIDNEYEGSILVDSVPKHYAGPKGAVKQGIGYVPKNRKEEGILPNLSVSDNMTISSLRRVSKGGVVRKKYKDAVVCPIMEQIDLRPRNPELNIVSLSGGNQQKCIIGRWISRQSRIMIFDEPTRGVDVGAIAMIYDLIHQMTQDGASVIVISSEFEEIHEHVDRLLVLNKGRLVGEVNPESEPWETSFELAVQ